MVTLHKFDLRQRGYFQTHPSLVGFSFMASVLLIVCLVVLLAASAK